MSEYARTIEVAARFYNAGNYAAAERLCRDVLKEKGDEKGALQLLGEIAYQYGRYGPARELLEKAISVGGADARIYNSLGVVLEAGGQGDAAMEAYRHAVALNANYAEAYHNLAVVQRSKGDYEGAIANCREALRIKGDFGWAYNTMGYCQQAMRRLDEAEDSYNRAIWANPNLAEAFNHLGRVYAERREDERAIAYFRRAVSIADGYAEAHNNLGMALRRAGDADSAVESFRNAVACDADFAQAHYNLANGLMEQCKCEEAIGYYLQAMELIPDFGWAHWNMAHALLLSGRFAEGWREYAWRHSASVGIVTYPHKIDVPRWDGRRFLGRLLVHYEQGYGDTIQFVRYMPMVKERGGTVVLECPAVLSGLLRGVDGIDEVIEAGDSAPLGQFENHCSLMDLPWIFGTRMETVPARVPYICADEGKVQWWRDRLGGGFKAGIVWAGSPKHGKDAARSCGVEWFLPLAGIGGVRLYSLQKGAGSEQAERCGGVIEDAAGELGDFGDTAAVVANMDVVICVDTAVAHLAGAMGKRVWVVLPYAPDWRWMLGRDDSVWYPTMRLFRQERRGDWEGVFARVKGELEVMAVNNEYRTEKY